MASDTLLYCPKDVNVDMGLKKETVCQLVHDLVSLLASCYVLAFKSQSLHWRIVGPHFYSLHQISQEHYEFLLETVDQLAERIRMLGKLPPISFSHMLKHAKVPEFTSDSSCHEMLGHLLGDHENMARFCRRLFKSAEDAGDIVTADLLTELCGFHEKTAWTLRATLEDYRR